MRLKRITAEFVCKGKPPTYRIVVEIGADNTVTVSTVGGDGSDQLSKEANKVLSQLVDIVFGLPRSSKGSRPVTAPKTEAYRNDTKKRSRPAKEPKVVALHGPDEQIVFDEGRCVTFADLPDRTSVCVKCGAVSGERPSMKYCGNGSDKDNDHSWGKLKEIRDDVMARRRHQKNKMRAAGRA